MKKLVAMMGLMTLGLGSAMAQDSKNAIGVNINYGTEIKNVGFGVKYQHTIGNAFVIEPTFNYYLKKDGVEDFDFAVNFHYDFKIGENFKIYPLVGLGYTHTKSSGGVTAWDDENENGEYDKGETIYSGSEGSASSGNFMVNVGAGAQYDINDKWALNLDLKYQIIKNFNQFAPTIGIAYKF